MLSCKFETLNNHNLKKTGQSKFNYWNIKNLLFNKEDDTLYSEKIQ